MIRKPFLTHYSIYLAATAILATNLCAQQSRITARVNDQQRFKLSGHIHPLAVPADDTGRVSPSLELDYVTLALTSSVAQQTGLEQLLAQQQEPSSANYHKWLTPEQYADHFGASQADLNQLTAWLQSHGLSIASTARARNWIAVNGTAAQIEDAFQTEIHSFVANGTSHFANVMEPSVPSAFAGVVAGIRGLNDFRMKPAYRKPRTATGELIKPQYTAGRSTHYLAPDDFATIYDIMPLFSASINGTGQKMVVAGQTAVNVSDLETFRQTYNLPGQDPQMVLVGRNPGVSQNDLSEADLDLEWSSAVARNASIIYVYSSDVMTSAQYAIDNNLAPVLSVSYGSCEPETPLSEATMLRSLAQQANAEGITWVNAAGDNGAADCDDSLNPGLSVDLPASIPEVTGMGGTTLAEGAVNYWSASNSSNGASALSYIPETTWNDSAADGGQPSAGGGGSSIYFSKPSWQTGPGVPADNARDVPDISFASSPNHDGYLVYSGGSLAVFGGTSCPTPAFAGLIVLLNQYLTSAGVQSSPGLGNINPKLYSLAQTAPNAFHDVTTGNNIVTAPCSTARGRTCDNPTVGYSAGPGYDEATGLGSVDGYKLVSAWSGAIVAPVAPKVSMTLLSNLNSLGEGDITFLIASVTSQNGTTPTGSVVFMNGSITLGSANLLGSAGTATATLAVSGSQLGAGSGTITAVYDQGTSSSVSASVTINVQSTGSVSSGTPVIGGMTNAASYKQVYAPGMLLSIFGSQLAPSTMTASSIPLANSMEGVAVTINNVSAPLLYVSSSLLNIQIPYEIPANSSASISVNNNGQVATQTFSVGAVAPGIFYDPSTNAPVPNESGSRGQTITLYITGVGALTPAVPTGSAPPSGEATSSLPVPVNGVTVSVGGVTASIPFIGETPGVVGVVQVNYQIPFGIATGMQPVVVTMGGTTSAPVYLTVTN